MKKEDLFKLLNKGKRANHFEPVKPKKKTFKAILYKYTGLSIIKTIERQYEDLKDDLTLIFKPVKRFTKKDLAPADLTKVYSNDNSVTKNDPPKMKNTEEVFSKKDDFVNWFDLDENSKNHENHEKSEEEEKKIFSKNITLKKEDGTVIGLGNFEDKF